jgi:hypothetical protein
MRLVALLTCCSAVAFAQDAREIVLRSVEIDDGNERIARNYTYVERNETRQVDASGRLKEKRILTHDVTLLEQSPYRRLIARDDQPLSAAEERKEQEKLRMSIEDRRKESPARRAKRLASWEEKRRKDREFLREIPDAFDFRIAGEEPVNGQDAWIIEATPRPGYRPRSSAARFLPKFKGRLWIAKQDSAWVRAEVEAIDNISIGVFLARFQKGARLEFEQTRVNGEVWLPKFVRAAVAARVVLVKSIRAEVDITYKDYRKFSSESRVVGFEPPR